MRPDTTVQLGTWQGAPLTVSIRLGTDDHATLTAVSRGRVVDWMQTDGSRLLGPIWDFCGQDALPDLDGDGLGEIGVPLGNGGGPYSVNVGVAVVQFAPHVGRFRTWGVLTTPKLTDGGRVLVEHDRHSGFGRAWSLTRYTIPADTLVETETILYGMDEPPKQEFEDQTWTRTQSRAGRPDQTSVVLSGDLPDNEEEWFGCLRP